MNYSNPHQQQSGQAQQRILTQVHTHDQQLPVGQQQYSQQAALGSNPMNPNQQMGMTMNQMSPVGQPTQFLFTDDQRRILAERSLARQDQLLSSILHRIQQRQIAQHRQLQTQVRPINMQQGSPGHVGHQQLQHPGGQMQYIPHNVLAGESSQPHSINVQRMPGQTMQAVRQPVQLSYPLQTNNQTGAIMGVCSNSQHNSPMSALQGGPHSVGTPIAGIYQPKSNPAPSASPQAFMSNSTGGPASVINAMRSVPSVPPQSSSNAQPGGASMVDATSPEYIAALGRLKEYHEQCKRLVSRLEIDVDHQRRMKCENQQEAKLLTSVRRVLEIMDGKRVVDIKLLERLINNVKSSLSSNNPTKGILDIGKKIAASGDIRPIKQALPDPWGSLRTMEIRLPTELANKTQSSKPPLRRRADHSDKSKIDPPSAEAKIFQNNEESKLKKSRTPEGAACAVAVNDTSETQDGIASLNPTLYDELKSLKLPYRLDCDFHPITRENCSTIPLLIEFVDETGMRVGGKRALLSHVFSPLHLSVPFDYPRGDVRVLPAGKMTGSLNQTIIDELRAQLDSTGPKTVTSIIESWTRTIKNVSMQSMSHTK